MDAVTRMKATANWSAGRGGRGGGREVEEGRSRSLCAVHKFTAANASRHIMSCSSE